eukprot:TRINITY_DN7212_c0_g1_i1.p1 TRINITY_DN7212_c0_g1~~TRINITY_DN7212_c0_g1_i1.p1  ORF type:complete len:674 (-),score=239.49 TRINITY_DN7212_c0_g1_i1:93-2114(-)
MPPRQSRGGKGGGNKRGRVMEVETGDGDFFEADQEERAAAARLSRAEEVQLFEMGSDIEDEELDSDDEQVVGRAEAKRIRRAKRAESSKQSKGGGIMDDLLYGDDDDEDEEEDDGEGLDEIDSDLSDGEDQQMDGELILSSMDQRNPAGHRAQETTHGSGEDAGKLAGGADLSLEDLMAAQPTGPGKKNKSLDRLSSKSAMPAPLGRAASAKLKREAGYNAASADVSRWTSAVKKNRESEQLVLVDDQESAPRLVSSAAIAGNSFIKPTPMELKVKELLNKAGVATSAQAGEAEGLALNKVTVEEVKARQLELAKMRSLMFAHEIKAKKHAKIKSRTFHKILKKENAKKDERYLKELEATDPEAAKEYRAQKHREYAEERMTLKHKNTSKWAKHALRRGTKADEGTKSALQEQLRKGQELRRKMEGESDEDDSSDEDHEDPLLWDAQDGAEEDTKKKGIFGLDFMKRGQDKRMKQAQAAAEGDNVENEAEQENAGRVKFEGKASGRAAVVDTKLRDFERKGRTLEFGPRSVAGRDNGEDHNGEEHKARVFEEEPFHQPGSWTTSLNRKKVEEEPGEQQEEEEEDGDISGEEEDHPPVSKRRHVGAAEPGSEGAHDGPAENPWLKASSNNGKAAKGTLRLVTDDLLDMKPRNHTIAPEVPVSYTHLTLPTKRIV